MRYLSRKLHVLHEWMQRLSGGRLDVIQHSVARFVAMQGPEAAATLAYYALFSLFPLILFLAAVMSYILESSEQAYLQTVMFFGSALPVSFTMVQDNLREVLELRGQIGVIGLIGALWAASSFFTTLARSVNRAWPKFRLRSVVQNRLIGLAMVGALFLLLLFSLLSSAFANLIPSLVDTIGGGNVPLFSPIWRLLLRLVPGVFSFLMFVALYRWVPNRLVCWRAVLQGAAMTVVLWESVKLVFGFYLTSGFSNYELLYVSLGTVMALMFWIYLSSLIALFGAYLVATLDLKQQAVVVEQPANAAAAPADHPSGAPSPETRHKPAAFESQPAAPEKMMEGGHKNDRID